jgi:hypothetical protein
MKNIILVMTFIGMLTLQSFAQKYKIANESISPKTIGELHNNLCKQILNDFFEETGKNALLLPKKDFLAKMSSYYLNNMENVNKYFDCCPTDNGGGCIPNPFKPKSVRTESDWCKASKADVGNSTIKSLKWNNWLKKLRYTNVNQIEKLETEISKSTLNEKQRNTIIYAIAVKKASFKLWSNEQPHAEMAGPITDADIAGATLGFIMGGPEGSLILGVGASLMAAAESMKTKADIFSITESIEEATPFSWDGKIVQSLLGVKELSFPSQKTTIRANGFYDKNGKHTIVITTTLQTNSNTSLLKNYAGTSCYFRGGQFCDQSGYRCLILWGKAENKNDYTVSISKDRAKKSSILIRETVTEGSALYGGVIAAIMAKNADVDSKSHL